MRPMMVEVKVTIANDFKGINFDVLVWVKVRDDFPFIHLNRVKGDVRRGRYSIRFIFGLWRLWVFIFTMNMPHCICSQCAMISSLLDPMSLGRVRKGKYNINSAQQKLV